MSNAMKKLKLLHHLTAASASHPPTHSPAAAQPTPQQQHHQQQQFPTPPASPVSPQATPTRHQYNPHAHYTDVLRSARAALHTLHASQPSYTNTTHPPPPPPSHNINTNNMGRQTTQCLLPGGFMILTPASSYDNTPGLCVPASPPPTSMAINHNHHGSPMQNSSVPRGNTTIYSSRPPPAASPSPKPSSSYQHLREQSRSRSKPPARPRQKLTKEAVSKVSGDSREARWERVLGYLREQRANTLPAAAAAAASPASAGTWSNYGSPSGTPPSKKTIDRKRRAEQIALIDARNRVLDTIDLQEQELRSCWSGGSGGTNGVDEFMWSEDEDDDIMPAPKGPPPQKILPEGYLGSTSGRGSGEINNDEGIFECEMQIDEYLQQPPTRLSTPSNQDRKRARPRSTPEELAFQRMWGKRIVEEMPALCRESELEGGLGRLMGRRMSAAY